MRRPYSPIAWHRRQAKKRAIALAETVVLYGKPFFENCRTHEFAAMEAVMRKASQLLHETCQIPTNNK